MGYSTVVIKPENILKPGTAHLPLGVLPDGKTPNLWEGKYSKSDTVAHIQEQKNQHSKENDLVGPGGSQDLQSEITSLDHTFTRIPVDGNITTMAASDGIGFGHFSNFSPNTTSKATITIKDQAALEPQIHKWLGNTGPATAKLEGSFKVLLVRTPNHDCSPAPKVTEALGNQVRFYFMHEPRITKDTQISYDDLEKNSILAAQLGFTKNDKNCYVKQINKTGPTTEASVQKVATDTIELRPDKGDKCTFHRNPLQMKVALQYAPDTHIYEMGGAKGLHLHTIGDLELDGKKVKVGGHILGFTDFNITKAEVMSVKRTTVKVHDGNGNNAVYREAYGRDNIGQAIATSALTKAGFRDPNNAILVGALSSLINASDFYAEKGKPWTSFICDYSKRAERCEELATTIATTIKNMFAIATSSPWFTMQNPADKAISARA